MTKSSTKKQGRFFLDADSSGHWYLVPASKRAEWNEWSNLSEDDERAWDEPEYAKRLNGHLSWVTFTDPKDEL